MVLHFVYFSDISFWGVVDFSVSVSFVGFLGFFCQHKMGYVTVAHVSIAFIYFYSLFFIQCALLYTKFF